MTRPSTRAGAAAALALLAACADDLPTAARPSAVPNVSNAVTAAPALTWLAPLGTGTAAAATFDAAAAPVVEVCVWTGTACGGAPVARFSTAPGAGEGVLTANAAAGQYEATWSLLNSAFTARRTYRVRVLRGAAELGGVSVDVVRGRWALARDDGTLAPLEAASALPVRFHVARETLRLYAAARGLEVGVAVGYTGTSFPANVAYTAVIGREFNVLVPENVMKWQTLRRDGPTSWRFQFTDQMMAYAEANGMRVRGHPLAWHDGNPAWVNSLTAANTTRAQAIALLKQHVDSVVGRYRGRIRDYDAANEAIADGTSGGRRPASQSVWERLIGPDWVDTVFAHAARADPAARLYYNDYGIETLNAKQTGAFNLVKGLLDAGVPVHGVGFQSHFVLGGVPTAAQLRQSMDRFAALGLAVQITELDVRVPGTPTAAQLAQQAAEYRRVVQACDEHPACNTVVTWGVDDGNSWIPATFPGFGAAHLFTAAFAPKPAYGAVLDYLAGR